jgi:hypothetical protein
VNGNKENIEYIYLLYLEFIEILKCHHGLGTVHCVEVAIESVASP